MSNLSDFFGGAAPRGSGSDPHAQPAFSTFYGGQSNLHPTNISYDHNMNIIGRSSASGSGTTSNRIDDWATDSGQGQINGTNPSSTHYDTWQNTSRQSGTNTFLGATVYQPHLGACPAPIAMAYANRDISGKAIRLNGTSIGLDQNYAIFTHSNGPNVGATAGFYITARSPYEGQAILSAAGGPGMGTVATANYVKLQAAGVLTNSYRLAVGGVSYNQRTKKLLILEREAGSSANWRPVIIHNAPNPAQYINNNAGYQTALAAAAAVSGQRVVGPIVSAYGGYSSGNESSIFVRPILSDDNSVTFLNMLNNYTINVIKWSWSGALIGGSFGSSTIVSSRANGTNIYNASTGSDYEASGAGAHWQMSLDGKTVLLFCQSYYTGSGLQYIMIDTVTGGLSKLIVKHDVTHANWVIPIGASNFVIMDSSNTDGTGMWTTRINWRDYDVYSGGSGTYTGILTQPSNWRVKQLDATYYTTCYPTVHQYIGADNKAIAEAEAGTWQA